MYTLHKLFPTPIIKFKFSKHDNYFFDNIEKKEKIPLGWECSVNSSYPKIEPKDTFITRRISSSLQKDLLTDIRQMFESAGMPTNISFNDMFWYNVYHNNQNQERHTHLSSYHNRNFWSGIYYNKNASATTFYPISTLYRVNKFDKSENSILADCYFDHVNILVDDGDVILFPPYLEHEVKPQKLDEQEMRLTFSFNITLI